MHSLVQRLFRNRSFVFHVITQPGQSKHLPLWLRSLADSYLLETPSPWLTFDAIQFLIPRLWKGMRVFEFGSGGSTLFWLLHGAHCVSVEHDPDWYALVRERLGPEASIDYRLVPPELVEASNRHGGPADPDAYTSSVSAFRSFSFRRYAAQINEFHDEWFDLVMVDGRARPSCIKHSVSKIKIGGMMCVDNADRDYYFERTRNYLEGFDAVEFPGVGPVSDALWKTTIFTRQQ